MALPFFVERHFLPNDPFRNACKCFPGRARRTSCRTETRFACVLFNDMSEKLESR